MVKPLGLQPEVHYLEFGLPKLSLRCKKHLAMRPLTFFFSCEELWKGYGQATKQFEASVITDELRMSTTVLSSV